MNDDDIFFCLTCGRDFSEAELDPVSDECPDCGRHQTLYSAEEMRAAGLDD